MDNLHNLLMKDPVRNVNIINFMRNYRIHRACREGESVLVEGTSDRNWIYISSEDSDELCTLLRKHQDPVRDRNFAVIEPWMEEYILQGRGMEWELRCDKYYLPADTDLSEYSLSVERLKPENAGYLYENYKYKQFLDADYIAERIEAGPAFAVFDGDKPAAWVMTHDDDALGLLHVMPGFRGRGYARALVSKISAEMRVSGQLPFMHIEEDNTASVNLALSCGYVRHSKISWFRV